MAVNKEEILTQLFRWLRNYFTIFEKEEKEIESLIDIVIEKCENNFKKSNNKYFQKGYNSLHSVMNMILLYYLSHELYKSNECLGLCDKVYYLNKIMHSVDLFYAVELPNQFGAEHPLGAVMGRANMLMDFSFIMAVLLVAQEVKMEMFNIQSLKRTATCMPIQVYWVNVI